MRRSINKTDEREVVLRANAALGCDKAASLGIRWVDGRIVGFTVAGMTSPDIRDAFASNGIYPNPAGWEIEDRQESSETVLVAPLSAAAETARTWYDRARPLIAEQIKHGPAQWEEIRASVDSLPVYFTNCDLREILASIVGATETDDGQWEIVSTETTEEPAFPTDAGVERPEHPGWHPCWHVPDGITCPLCDAPVIPCYNLNPAGPPCAHARWKPGATARGSLYAHVECVEAHESGDAFSRACADLEECIGLEARAWEQARTATGLRIRSELAFMAARKRSGR